MENTSERWLQDNIKSLDETQLQILLPGFTSNISAGPLLHLTLRGHRVKVKIIRMILNLRLSSEKDFWSDYGGWTHVELLDPHPPL